MFNVHLLCEKKRKMNCRICGIKKSLEIVQFSGTIHDSYYVEREKEILKDGQLAKLDTINQIRHS